MRIIVVILGIAVALGLVLASPTGNFMFVALTLGSGLFFMIGVGYWAFLGPMAIALTALALNPLTEVLRKRLLRGFEGMLARAPALRTP